MLWRCKRRGDKRSSVKTAARGDPDAAIASSSFQSSSAAWESPLCAPSSPLVSVSIMPPGVSRSASANWKHRKNVQNCSSVTGSPLAASSSERTSLAADRAASLKYPAALVRRIKSGASPLAAAQSRSMRNATLIVLAIAPVISSNVSLAWSNPSFEKSRHASAKTFWQSASAAPKTKVRFACTSARTCVPSCRVASISWSSVAQPKCSTCSDTRCTCARAAKGGLERVRSSASRKAVTRCSKETPAPPVAAGDD